MKYGDKVRISNNNNGEYEMFFNGAEGIVVNLDYTSSKSENSIYYKVCLPDGQFIYLRKENLELI